MTIVPRTAAPSQPADFSELPPHILERLAAEGIRSAADWRGLTDKRRSSIFGITAATMRQINTLTRVRR